MSIGPVTLQGDSFIPVMKGMGASLGLNDFEPGVLPGGLVEVTVNDCEYILHLWRIFDEPIFNALSYIMLSISKQFCVLSFLEVRATSKT